MTHTAPIVQDDPSDNLIHRKKVTRCRYGFSFSLVEVFLESLETHLMHAFVGAPFLDPVLCQNSALLK